MSNNSSESDLLFQVGKELISSIRGRRPCSRELNEAVRRNFLDKEDIPQIGIQVVVPVHLPPGEGPGFCLRILKEVEQRLSDLGGGRTTTEASGGWLDEVGNEHTEGSKEVETHMPVTSWTSARGAITEAILLIQAEGRQKCVFVRVNGWAWGGPISLLPQSVTDRFPDSPGERDPEIDPDGDPEGPPSGNRITQTAKGDNNIQIGGNAVISNQGSSSSHVGGDVNQITNNYSGMQEGEVRELFSRMLSEAGITSGTQEDVSLTPEEEEGVDQALEGAAAAEEAGIEFDPWEYITLGNAAKLRGRTFTAEGYYREAQRLFIEVGNRQGEAQSLIGLGIIAERRGDLDEAERLQRESLAIVREVGDRLGEASSLSNLGIIADSRGDYAEAERLFRESLAIENFESEVVNFPDKFSLKFDFVSREFTEAIKRIDNSIDQLNKVKENLLKLDRASESRSATTTSRLGKIKKGIRRMDWFIEWPREDLPPEE